jgi:hypothetical protein
MLHFAALAEEEITVKIKSPKDFWAGIMFVSTGGFFLVWAMAYYQMGTAVRMGPAYFPALLGGLLAVLGAIVLMGSLVGSAAGPDAQLKLPFNIIDLVIALAIFGAVVYLARLANISVDYAVLAATTIVTVLTVLMRPQAKALVLISAGCVAYGYLMKPLGLIAATAALIFISAYGGHEFKWKEVIILFVVLVIFSVLVFVKGLTLPFPICPAFMENCPIR